MNKYFLLLLLFVSSITNFLYAQDDTSSFGLKAGANLGKYTPNKNAINYKYKLGFYAGGFYTLELNKSWKIQPEFLFALQGSTVNVKGIPITDINGNILENTAPFNYDYEIHELTISIPLTIKAHLSDKFYFESGPQIGFIVDRKITSSQQLLSGTNTDFIIQEGDTFDFGVNLGLGYVISNKIACNFRVFSGLIKRDDAIKSFVFNFGLEYKL